MNNNKNIMKIDKLHKDNNTESDNNNMREENEEDINEKEDTKAIEEERIELSLAVQK